MVNLQNSRVDGIGDNRHILVDYEWDKDYQDTELNVHVDNIYREWQELTGGNFYDMMFQNDDAEKYNILRIEALNLMYFALTLHQYAIYREIAEKFKFKHLKSQNDILQKTKQIEEKININRDEQKKKAKHIVYADLITELKLYFPEVKFDKEITCEEYASWINKIKAQKNG